MAKILSIEVDNRNIKILEGARSGSSIAVYKSIITDTEPGSIDDGKILDMEAVVNIVKKALSNNKINTKKTIISINTNSTITRSLELPILKSKSETMSMVKSELEQFLPVDLNQYKLIYKQIGKVPADSVEKGKYVVYGLPISMYDQYMELSKKLGLELLSLDLSYNGLDNISEHNLTVNKTNLKLTTAFIEIGYNTISFSVVDNGKNSFSRISANGMFDVVKNLGSAFNMSQSKALEEIGRLSLAEDRIEESTQDVSKLNILENYVGMWTDEIRRYIRYYNSNNKENQISKIYVYGAYSWILGLEQYFESHLNVETQFINELSNIVLKDKSSLKAFDVKTYFNTLLLLYTGKKDINFLTDQNKKHKNSFNTRVAIMAVSLIAVLSLGLYLYSYILEKTALERQISEMDKFMTNEENIRLNDEATAIKNKVTLLEKYKSEVEKVQASIKSEDAVTTVIFEEIAKATPQGAKINAMSVDKTNIQLQLTSGTRLDAAQLEKNLKKIEFIDNVYIPAITAVAEGGSAGYSYSVVCGIKDVIVNEAE